MREISPIRLLCIVYTIVIILGLCAKMAFCEDVGSKPIPKPPAEARAVIDDDLPLDFDKLGAISPDINCYSFASGELACQVNAVVQWKDGSEHRVRIHWDATKKKLPHSYEAAYGEYGKWLDVQLLNYIAYRSRKEPK